MPGREPSVDDLQQAGLPCQPLEGFPGFYTVPASVTIADNPLYRQARILPLDPSSALAVDNLDLQPGEHVLDLCCAPGTKLALISARVCPPDGAPMGSVTGVDVAPNRLAAAATLAKKYRLPRVRLFAADGRAFQVGVHEILGPHEPDALRFADMYERGGKPTYSSTAYRRFPGRLLPSATYDKVLVDAQCTHDGSIKHVRKQMRNGWRDFDPSQYTEEGLLQLYRLQLGLLESGLDRLRPGGILVYSTCSLTHAQNEGILATFLERHQDQVCIEQARYPEGIENKCTADGRMLRLHPSPRHGGGFFICRLRKLCPT